MLPYTVHELAPALQGSPQHVDPQTKVSGLTTDSRKIQPGQWFVCLQGENSDGHSYAAQAMAHGAAGLIASAERLPAELQQAPRIEVASPNQALLDWAADYRKRFSGHVLGITGSNGKTTTKEIARHLCQSLDATAHATQGNYNNFIGVPLTLLSAPLDTSWWVVEMGTNHFGEIETLAKVSQPTVGLLTSIGESHLEFLLNTAGVAREKSGLWKGLVEGGQAWIPANVLERSVLEREAEQIGVVLHSFGLNESSAEWNLQLQATRSDNGLSILGSPIGELQTSLNNPLALQNLAGVLAALHSTGVDDSDLRKAVAELDLDVAGRMQLLPRGDVLWVNDSYNANPSSFRSVLQSLRQMYPSRRLLLAAGSMAELGDQAPELHHQVGVFAADCGVSTLFACGPYASHLAEGWQATTQRLVHVTEEPGDLLPLLQQTLQPNDVILVKGSRSARMERILPA
jgi:UDP-N-acetylmuramoyl-tripeptide--D-alanyl-D-alanine ligase